MARFSDFPIHATTQAALAAQGIDTPTPIQDAALPHLFAGRDIVGQARTGSGKTLAFGLPLIEKIDPQERGVQALVLTPTRELATQVGGVLADLGKGRRIHPLLIFGGVGFTNQEMALRRGGVPIVVGTPGRILDLLKRGSLSLGRVRFLVLDEADEMLDRGFAPDVERILSRVPQDRQTALFSATVPEWVLETGAKHLRQPVQVHVDTAPEDVPQIDHIVYDVPMDDKIEVLKLLLDARGDGATIVFGRTKHGVKRLGERLSKLGYPVAALQGNLSQNARDRVMADFRSGETTILLATNVAARGIDVATVERVINFDLPESSDLLTHRVGRTGRMGRLGSAITLVAPEEAAKWRQLERDMGRAFPRTIWRDEYATNPPTLDMPTQPPARQIVPRAAAPERRPAPSRMQPGRPSQNFGNAPTQHSRPAQGYGNAPVQNGRPSQSFGNAPQPGNRPSQGFGNGPVQNGRPSQGFSNGPAQSGRPAQGFAPAPVQGGRPAQSFGNAPQQGGGPRGYSNDEANARPSGGNMRRRPRRSPVSMD